MSLVVYATYVLTSSDPYLDPERAFVTLIYISIINFEGVLLPMEISAVTQVELPFGTSALSSSRSAVCHKTRFADLKHNEVKVYSHLV